MGTIGSSLGLGLFFPCFAVTTGNWSWAIAKAGTTPPDSIHPATRTTVKRFMLDSPKSIDSVRLGSELANSAIYISRGLVKIYAGFWHNYGNYSRSNRVCVAIAGVDLVQQWKIL